MLVAAPYVAGIWVMNDCLLGHLPSLYIVLVVYIVPEPRPNTTFVVMPCSHIHCFIHTTPVWLQVISTGKEERKTTLAMKSIARSSMPATALLMTELVMGCMNITMKSSS